MSRESYEYYLQLLNVAPDASDEIIRTAIVRELRLWTHRTNSHKLEVRQKAERMIAILENVDEVLLAPERKVWAQRLLGSDVPSPGPPNDSPVDAGLIARTIEQVALVRGQRTQERRGTVLYKRTGFFHKGVDYFLEEVVHKKYQAELDFKRCHALQHDLLLFDWHCRSIEISGDDNVKVYVPGIWVTDLIAIGREI